MQQNIVLDRIAGYKSQLAGINTINEIGIVHRVRGQLIEGTGLTVAVGDQCTIITAAGVNISAEVIGFTGNVLQIMAFEDTIGVGVKDRIISNKHAAGVRGGEELLGRVINCQGQVIDGGAPIASSKIIPIHRQANHPLELQIIDSQLTTGIRAIDSFVPIGKGQKIGIMSGSGVGKSVLMGMLAKYSNADVNVVALIGERGREVNEFMHEYLQHELMQKTIVVVSTSEETPLARVRGAYSAIAIADYFRDQGNDVLLLFDSMTRFARAQREIGLSAGEPPTTRGYPPSVYGLMPKIIEGCGITSRGSVTGIFTVLVEGDDLEEPISDALRGLLDGHIVLSKKLATAAVFPAIDILQSLSRLETKIADQQTRKAANIIRAALAEYRDLEELIHIGAYQRGTNARLDRIVDTVPKIRMFISQDMHEHMNISDTKKILLKLASYIDVGEGDTSGKK